MTWLLAYLLVGFVLSWVGSNVFGKTSDNDWRWELVAVIGWPFVIVFVIVGKIQQRIRKTT